MYVYIVIAALFLVLLRGLIGPSFADRLIGISIVSNIIMLFVVIHSINIQSMLCLDIALILAMLSFTGLLGVAKYAVWHEEKKKEALSGRIV